MSNDPLASVANFLVSVALSLFMWAVYIYLIVESIAIVRDFWKLRRRFAARVGVVITVAILGLFLPNLGALLAVATLRLFQ